MEERLVGEGHNGSGVVEMGEEGSSAATDVNKQLTETQNQPPGLRGLATALIGRRPSRRRIPTSMPGARRRRRGAALVAGAPCHSSNAVRPPRRVSMESWRMSSSAYFDCAFCARSRVPMLAGDGHRNPPSPGGRRPITPAMRSQLRAASKARFHGRRSGTGA